MGNVLGSNIFDLLVAIPAGVLVAGAAPVDFGVAAPLSAGSVSQRRHRVFDEQIDHESAPQ